MSEILFFRGALMPNVASAVKRVRVIERKALRNKSFKSALRTLWKTATEAVENFSGNEDERSVLVNKVRSAVKKMDQGVSKGIIHKNTARRKKSRLVQKYNFTLGD